MRAAKLLAVLVLGILVLGLALVLRGLCPAGLDTIQMTIDGYAPREAALRAAAEEFLQSGSRGLSLAPLEDLLGDRSLNLKVEMDNNPSGDLGWLDIGFPASGKEVRVRGKAAPGVLESALRLIDAQTGNNDDHQVWDLCDLALVKRDWRAYGGKEVDGT